MTGLLISVRNASEARVAMQGGANFIDVKEPTRGPLGAAAPTIWRDVVREVAGRAPCSAALGEICNWSVAPSPQELRGMSYAKAGLSACDDGSDWRARWRNLKNSLPECAKLVAVVYADWELARAPTPDEILDHASELGCAALLIDTYDKRAGNLFTHLTHHQIESLLGRGKELGMLTVLGGSLQERHVPDALSFAPDLIAVRGAACRRGRNSFVCRDRVAALSAALQRQVELA